MSIRVVSYVVVVMILLTCLPAQAGTLYVERTIDMWSMTLDMDHWLVADDVDAYKPYQNLYFEMEGMTYYDGMLYVTADTDISGSHMVGYAVGATGDLSDSTITYFPMLIPAGPNPDPNPDPGWENFPECPWGPEGLTVNTSGAGYGAFDPVTELPKFVSVDSSADLGQLTLYDNACGLIDLNQEMTYGGSTLIPAGDYYMVDDVQLPEDLDPDDITYVPSRDQFAVLLDAHVPDVADVSVKFYNHTAAGLTPDDGAPWTPALFGSCKGMATITAEYVRMLTGVTLDDPDALLICSESEEVAIFTHDGQLVGDIGDFGALGATETESVAIDEENSLLYLGDQDNWSIYVVELPLCGRTQLPADIDYDCEVEMDDIDLLKQEWNNTGCSSGNDWCSGCDLSRDGVVDLMDATHIITRWGISY